MGKFTFIVGAGLGYVLGTRAGRQQYERLKSASATVWQNPRLQSTVHRAEERIGGVAREKGSQLTDKVAGKVKERITGSASGSEGTTSEVADGMTGSTPPPGAPEPTPPQPDIEQR